MKNVIFGVNLLGSSIYQVLRHRVLRVLVLKMLQLKNILMTVILGDIALATFSVGSKTLKRERIDQISLLFLGRRHLLLTAIIQTRRKYQSINANSLHLAFFLNP